MKTKHTLSYISVLLITVACQKDEGRIVEIADILRPQADMPYVSSRNGQSSVDEYIVGLLRGPLEVIERRSLAGSISNPAYTEILRCYTEDTSYIKLADEITSLSLAATDQVRKDIRSTFLTAKGIPLYGAQQGTSGDVGRGIGRVERVYVDEKGIAPARLFIHAIDRAFYLDEILLYHLDERFSSDAVLRREHQNIVLLAGENYT